MAKADPAPKEPAAPAAAAAAPVAEQPVALAAVDAVEKVLVEIPKDFRLTDHTGVHDFKAGIQRVERWVVDHWFAKGHGVKEVKE